MVVGSSPTSGAKKLSQGALAFLLEVDKSYISNIENGMKYPTLATSLRSANVLEASVDYLLK